MPLEYAPGMRIHPPRPQSAIPPSELGRIRGFVAQYKYNDVRTLVVLTAGPGGPAITLLNRHLVPHRFYHLSPGMRHSLLSLRLAPDRHQVLDGGLLHRVAGVRDRLVLWDILVHDGIYLVGVPLLERYARLLEACGNPATEETQTGLGVALEVNSQVWLAPVFRDRLEERFSLALRTPLIEGLVLKNPGARLERAFGERNNESWQIRVRKPHVNYSY